MATFISHSPEETLAFGIASALPGGMPEQLKLSLPNSLAIAGALELVSEELSKIILAFSKIRNNFAHTTSEEVLGGDEQRLRNALVPVLEVDLKKMPTRALIQAALTAAVVLLRQTNERARLKRLDQEVALAQWERRHTLSLAQIQELLAGEAIAESPVNVAQNQVSIEEEIRGDQSG